MEKPFPRDMGLKDEYRNLSECPAWSKKIDVTLADFGEGGKESVVIDPGNSIPINISISKENLPPVALSSDSITDLRFSTRSCLAQAGAFVFFGKESRLSEEDIAKLEAGEKVNVKADLRVYGNNPMKFGKGDQLGQFFHPNERDRVRGDELRKLVKDGLVTAENGKEAVEGKDFVIFEKGPTGNDPYAIAIRVTNQRFCIPGAKLKEPHLRVTSRQDVYDNTVEVKEEVPEDVAACSFYLQITQPEIHLPEHVIGVLSNVTPKKDVVHLPSHLLEPGTNWAIRLEINGGSTNWVLINIFRSPLIVDQRPPEDKEDITSGLKKAKASA